VGEGRLDGQHGRERNILSPRANIPEGCNQRYALALTYLPFCSAQKCGSRFFQKSELCNQLDIATVSKSKH
jgi:hypothetical protein